MLTRIENFKSIRGGDNYNGRISNDFVAWLVRAGVDPMPVQRKKRVVNLKSFHSTRHAMSSRLIGAGVSGELARLVTDHDSPQIQRKYVHSEIKSLKEAMKAARKKSASGS